MKQDTRTVIIEAAAPLIHRQGFHRTGLKDILEAAGVPKGSFYFYFPSKEAFGLAVIDHFAGAMASAARSLLDDDATPPLDRLAGFFSVIAERMRSQNCERGCPIGNLAQELSDLSPAMRQRLSQVMAGFSSGVAALLRQAAQAGNLPPGLDPDRTAAFLVDAWEGALLRAKADKDPAALDRFQEFVFTRLLR